MSVWDWVEVGLMDHHTEIPQMKGSFGVTCGDAIAGYFGARHAHIFGGEIKLVCDPEDMLFGKLEEFMPGVAAILGGTGGNTTFNYGCNVAATYVGPKMEIRRAPVINKTSDYIIARPNAAALAANPDAIDEAMVVALTVMSIILCAVPAALEIAFVVLYQGHPPPEGDETAAKLKISAQIITTRMMAFIKLLEHKGSLVQFAEQWGKEAALLFASAGVAALAAIPSFWPALYAMASEGCLQKCFKELAAELTAD